jgi:hypothetical protein
MVVVLGGEFSPFCVKQKGGPKQHQQLMTASLTT